MSAAAEDGRPAGAEPVIAPSILREHIEHLRELMPASDFAAVIVFHPSNMIAFTGTSHSSSDRLTCGAVTRDGAVVVVCPHFERSAVGGAEAVATIHTWEEHEDPYVCFAAALRQAGVRSGAWDWTDGCGLMRRCGLVWRVTECRSPPPKTSCRVRICKTAAEREAMRAAHRRGEQVYFALQKLVRPGVREIELQRKLIAEFETQRLDVAPMIQSGPNAALPHNPTGERGLAAGDAVVVDSVTQTGGYTNDLTRTFAVGEPPVRVKAAYRAVRAAQAAVFEAARPGVRCGALDELARRVITDAGFGPFFAHRLGHGIGIECHEPPYLVGGNVEVLRPGMCCTVEPGIYVPGEFGVRIEDDIIITADGCEVIRGELGTDVSAEWMN